MTYDVFGMCNPLYDIQAEVPETVLTELAYEKGGMYLIEAEQQRELVAKIYQYIVNTEAGGSGANTMIGIAQLGGTACYTGKLGNDEHGTLYTNGLNAKNVKCCAAQGEGTTGISVILVTPDAQRTMFTFLGMCRELGPDDVAADILKESKYLYVTGYLWDTDTQKEAVLKAMREAKAAGVKVALSLSDPFCVNRNKDDFLAIVQEHVDLLIGNRDEAQALTDTATPQDAIAALAPYCELAAVTMDSQGSLLRSGNETLTIPACSVTPVDTTGAGDMYAAGILYGLTQGLSLERTGRIASCAAAQVVGKMGPRLDTLDQSAIDRFCNN